MQAFWNAWKEKYIKRYKNPAEVRAG